MTSHDLARKLLDGPDLPVVSGLNRSGYGEPVESIEIIDAYTFTDGFGEPKEKVVELVFGESSTHASDIG